MYLRFTYKGSMHQICFRSRYQDQTDYIRDDIRVRLYDDGRRYWDESKLDASIVRCGIIMWRKYQRDRFKAWAKKRSMSMQEAFALLHLDQKEK